MVKISEFKGQCYEKLKKEYSSCEDNFTDPSIPEFGLTGSNSMHGGLEWKRIREICPEPRFASTMEEEFACSGSMTGGLLTGTSWLISAATALTSSKALWETVVPDSRKQEWVYKEGEEPEHPGIFHFRFWRFGHWVDVVVDDLLPVKDGELISSHFVKENEFWLPLLEKAYAKFCGSYGAMLKGNLCDVLVDLTSGFSETIDLKRFKGTMEERVLAMKDLLFRTEAEHGLICSSISPLDASHSESKTASGLQRGHDYVVTAIREIHLDSSGHQSSQKIGEKLVLVRLRDPWGKKEWDGPYSESSLEWKRLEESEKQKLGLILQCPSDFWMPLENFTSEFSKLTICHVINHSYCHKSKGWHETHVLGAWTRPNHAGGCPTHDTFLKNPQYYFDIPRDNLEVIVQLVQEEQPENHGAEFTRIGFHIMKAEENREHRVHKQKIKVVTSDYIRGRSVLWRGRLKKGRHVLIPTTFDPNVAAEYMVRIHCEEPVVLTELIDEHPEPIGLCAPFSRPPVAVTQITVECAEGLAENENTFCIIKVEDHALQSDIVHNSKNPQWNLQGVFFRKDVCKPVMVEIWEKQVHSHKDRFLGCAIISGESESDNGMVSLKKALVGRGKNSAERHPGEVTILIATYEDLNAT